MKIQTNTAASYALGSMAINEKNTQQSIQRLSSGFRINRAADDAAGLATANKLRNDGKALSQAQKNAAQGAAMLQTMDGATQQVSTILDRMKELAAQGNSANVGNQGGNLQNEFSQLRSEISRISGTTQYQGTKLVDGTFGNSLDSTSNLVSQTTANALSKGTTVSSNGALAGSYTLAFTAGSGSTNDTLKITMGSGSNAPSETIDLGAANANRTAGNLVDSGKTNTISSDKFGISFTFDGTTAKQGTAAAIAGSAITVGTQDTIKITAGTSGGEFQVGASGQYGGTDASGNQMASGDRVAVDAINLKTDATGLGLEGLDISTQNGAAQALTQLDKAVNSVNTSIGKLGAAESRFDFASSVVATTLQNTQAAESTIRDTDMAHEMTNFTKNNILQQAAQSMLSQANQGSQGILKLLG